jgi:hypothetical protein
MRDAEAALLEAFALAERGIPCFPCAASKAPTIPGGFKSAASKLDGVSQLWRRHPGPLVGVPTGRPSGLDVLDIDPRNAGDQWLTTEQHRLPTTRTHRTRSGGWHFLFRHRLGIRNSAGRIAPGVDIRGAGGYIIWWPAAGLSVENPEALAEWPAWLFDQVAPKTQARPLVASTTSGAGYAAAALRRAVEAVGRATPGRRNDTLNREAFGLSRFALTGALDAQSIATALATAGLAAGLPEREIRGTLASAFAAAGLSL